MKAPRVHTRVHTILLTSLLLLGLMGCFKANDSDSAALAKPSQREIVRPTPPAQTVPKASQSATPVNPKLVTANTRFGFKLFSQLRSATPTENLFISPTSIAIALSMTANGAAGSTQQAMTNALEVQGLTMPEINQANASLKALLQRPDEQVELAIANSLWARDSVAFNPSFLATTQQFYDAQVTNLNFNDANTPKIINDWVRDQTRGKIDKIVDRVNPDDVLFLINAIYFKGKWTNEFQAADTKNKPFYLLNGKTKSHPMMTQTGDYQYLETDQFQAVSLPYGKKRVSMYLFVPKKSSSLTEFSKTLTADSWTTWIKQFRKQPGSIDIPRFKLEYQTELKPVLSALGMAPAFATSANFSNLSDRSTKIDQVKHKTFVEVNEEGTEAAGATSVGIVATSAPPTPKPPFKLIADRPFFFAIRDNQTGTILFMGTLVNPQ